MPMLNAVKRRLIEHLATLITEVHIGSDGTVATAEDGGARTLARATPRIQIIDDTSLLVEVVFNASYVFAKPVQEVYIQYKDASTGEFIPVCRADINSFTKNAENEVRFSFILEVS